MLNYYISKKGNFTHQEFNNEIELAIAYFSENLKPNKVIFNKTRHSINICYTINDIEYEGTYISIQITIKEKTIGVIDCFLDNKKIFMELSYTSV
ncbi:hypothetical protein [Flavobacterium haoranii]|uniref:Uncharacterized protein n=1 Tax=Flavobacterium haoranii TaxID=683124 RepID=A0A1M6H4T6_9FLAO|nr:hypothetical protein [Flavobacterium haoranii]SHJ17205.1 hypothetical protein SAMN05444337_1430 [Flavobacterium haoranii]